LSALGFATTSDGTVLIARRRAEGKNYPAMVARTRQRAARAAAARIAAARPLADRQPGRGQNISRPGMKIISPGMS